MGAVLTAVGIACCGAFAFGYHLGVVNGPLEVRVHARARACVCVEQQWDIYKGPKITDAARPVQRTLADGQQPLLAAAVVTRNPCSTRPRPLPRSWALQAIRRCRGW
jgi:hypothetical protein